MRELILGLARPVLRLLGTDERGAVGVLVGVLIGGGVLLGMGAMVLDVGQLYQERAELQNGAGAAALAVAGSCANATNGTCDPASVPTIASTIASKNASSLTGHQEKVDLICGSGGLAACPPSTGAMTDCPPAPSLPPNGNYVDVHTSTKTPSGSLLPPVLARALLGNGSYQGTDVGACAQAIWGPAQQSDSLALTVSLCAWYGLTGDTDYTTDPDEGKPGTDDGDSDSDTSGFNTPIPLYIKGKAKSCAGPAGGNLAGGFDWLNTDTDNDGENTSDTDNDGDASNTCTARIDLTTDTSYNNTGNNVSSACQAALQNDVASYLAGNPVKVYLPVFDASSGTGVNATYSIIGLAGFVITGYANIPGMPDAGVNSQCTASTSVSGNNAPCIQGYFTPGLDPVSSWNQDNNSYDFGAIGIKLTG